MTMMSTARMRDIWRLIRILMDMMMNNSKNVKMNFHKIRIEATMMMMMMMIPKRKKTQKTTTIATTTTVKKVISLPLANQYLRMRKCRDQSLPAIKGMISISLMKLSKRMLMVKI
jgi:hypothetical protein